MHGADTVIRRRSRPEPNRGSDAAGTAIDLLAFIDESPSPFHACAEVAARLDRRGFSPLAETDPWPSGPGRWYVRRGGSLAAWAVGRAMPAETGFRIVGAHTDSPNLRIKPRPDAASAGYRQLGVEVYGGALLNSWLDRDLGLSGRAAVRRRGATEERLFKVDQPLLRIPQLAIHLDRDITDKGLKLNAQSHMEPIWELGDLDEGGFTAFLAGELGVAADDVLAWDAMTHDLTPGRLIGRRQEFLSAARIDNLASCFCATVALLSALDEQGPVVPVISLFDHEEVGSVSERGAASTLLPMVLERTVLARDGDRDAFHRALAGSLCVSADGAHATHPNYPDRHEPAHHVHLNGGPVIKHNVNARYATDAIGVAAFETACRTEGVPTQRFVGRSDLPCGSTIGPVTAARLGIVTVDVGMPQLAMHSARETAGAKDPAWFVRALGAFLRG